MADLKKNMNIQYETLGVSYQDLPEDLGTCSSVNSEQCR